MAWVTYLMCVWVMHEQWENYSLIPWETSSEKKNVPTLFLTVYFPILSNAQYLTLSQFLSEDLTMSIRVSPLLFCFGITASLKKLSK